MKINVIHLVLIVATNLFFTCCSEKTPSPNFTQTIVGEWDLLQVQYDGQPATDLWRNIQFTIEQEGDSLVQIELSKTPIDTLWPMSSTWRRYNGNEDAIELEVFAADLGRNLVLAQDELRLTAKIDSDELVLERFLYEKQKLALCCDWTFKLSKK